MAQALAGHPWKQVPAAKAIVAEVGQVEEGLRGAAHLAQLPGEDRARVAGQGRRCPPALRAVLA